jgi:ABC-type transporter Mla MlaB component
MAVQPYAERGRIAEQSERTLSWTLRVVSTPPKAYTLGLTLSRRGASVCLAGEIDLAAAGDVAQLMDSLDSFSGEIHIDLSQVAFLDTSGLQPLIEATRRRQSQGLPPVSIDAATRPVKRLLEVAAVGGDPVLDVAAWDQFNETARGKPLLFWRRAPADRPWPSSPDRKARGAISDANVISMRAAGDPQAGPTHGRSDEAAGRHPEPGGESA